MEVMVVMVVIMVVMVVVVVTVVMVVMVVKMVTVVMVVKMVMVVMVVMEMMVVVVVMVVTSCLLDERPQLLGGDHAVAVSVKELESLNIFFRKYLKRLSIVENMSLLLQECLKDLHSLFLCLNKAI